MAALAVAAAAVMAGGLTAGAGAGTAAADTPAQTYVVACPAADVVTPALNVNLVENPGAEDTSTSPGNQRAPVRPIPDCWTVSSPYPAPGAIFGSVSRCMHDAIVVLPCADPADQRVFYGGSQPAGQTETIGDNTTATQLIDLSSLPAGGQPFKLTADVGGYNTEPDEMTVSATFEDASGATLGVATVGPVTKAQRASKAALFPQFWYGTVPAGTQQVLVQMTDFALTAGGVHLDGIADNLDLTIGSSAAAPSGPLLQTVTYTPAANGGALYKPAGISAADGHVYVSDTGANEVARIDSSTGDGVITSNPVTTTSVIAGQLSSYGERGDGGKAAAASLDHPEGTAQDAQGDVFIADSGDSTVREVTAAGTIRRFAGTTIAGLGYAGPVPYGFPAALSSLDNPDDVTVNAAGDVYVADTYNNRVVEVTPAGQVFAVAGDGVAGYTGDGGLGAFAQLDGPAGVAVDARGNLYIADSGNNVIRRIDAKTGIITTVAGDHAAGKASDGLGGFSGDGGPATSAELDDPQGVALDGAGDLFIADTFNNAVREVTPAGTISTVVNAAGAGGAAPAPGAETAGGAPTASRLNTPYGVAVDASTEVLYVADTSNNTVAQVINLAAPGTAAGPVAPTSH